MGVKIKLFDDVWVFLCPGCKDIHPFDKRWKFNGDQEKPTFTPSLLVRPLGNKVKCHSFVTDGRIKFLGDCDHDSKNTTVEIPDWEDDFF